MKNKKREDFFEDFANELISGLKAQGKLLGQSPSSIEDYLKANKSKLIEYILMEKWLKEGLLTSRETGLYDFQYLASLVTRRKKDVDITPIWEGFTL